MHVYHEANQQAFEYFASQVHQTRQQQPEQQQQQQQQPKQSEQQLVDNTNAVAAALPTCSSGGSVSLPLQPELPAPTPPAHLPSYELIARRIRSCRWHGSAPKHCPRSSIEVQSKRMCIHDTLSIGLYSNLTFTLPQYLPT
jgi:hypothetical protein